MANNCLITKLKGIVDNNELPKFGELVINLNNLNIEYGGPMSFDSNDDITLELTGSGQFYIQQGDVYNPVGKSITGRNFVYLYVGGISKGDQIKISNKYSVSRIQCLDQSNYFWGDTDYTGLSSIGYFSPYWQRQEFNIETICQYSKNVTNVVAIYNEWAYGSIEKCVEYQISLGRTSGQIDFALYGGSMKCTFHGIEWFKNYDDRSKHMIVTFNNGSATVTWDGQQVASYNGTTWTYNS